MVELGESLPKLKLVDTELQKVDVLKASKGKPVVVAFFPGAFTGVCTKEMCALRDNMSNMNSMNANLFAVSVDGPFANKEFKQKNGLNFPVLSDYKKKAIKSFDVVQEDFAHVKGYKTAKRAVFVADSQGMVKYKWVSDDPSVEPNYAEIQSALQSIK